MTNNVVDYQDFSGRIMEEPSDLRRIVSAAMRYSHDGLIVASPRHFDSTVHQFLLKHREYIDMEAEQGFIDTHGVFLTRGEAWKVAYEANQIVRRVGNDTSGGGRLHSENLY